MTTPAPKPSDAPGPPPAGAPPMPAAPPLRLQVVSNGDPVGTQLVDGAGNPVTFVGCHGRLDVRWEAGSGKASLVLMFPQLDVQVEGTPASFQFQGLTLGDRPAPVALGLAAAPPPGGPPHPIPADVLGQGQGLHPTTGAAMRHNDDLNSAQSRLPGRL